MGALSSKLRSAEGGRVLFYCVGCNMPHMLPIRGVTPDSPQSWTWNKDVDKPVFNPSVLVRWDSLSLALRAKSQEFYKTHGRYPTRQELPADVKHVCHSFVGCNGAQPGEIVYLSDCTHDYAGKTIPLPNFPHSDWDS